jgi:hypothetical protein
MFDFDLSTLVNGGAGLAALYLGIQIKAMLAALKTEVRDLRSDVANLQGRVSRLEGWPAGPVQ